MNRIATSGRLSLRVKVIYGAGDVGAALSASAIATYLMFFYTDVAGLSIGLAGLVGGIARFWDAIVDPPMGYISDKTRSRFGRRRFWFGIAALPLGACVYALFSPPEALGQWGLFGWMLVTYLFANSFLTMFLTPYYALGAEMSDDPDERTQIVAIRLMFQYMGAMAGGFMPVLALSYTDVRQGYSHVAAGFGAFAACAILLAFFGTREHRGHPLSSKASFRNFWTGVLGSLQDRPFRILLLTFLLMSVGGGVYGSVSIYALIYCFGFTPLEVGFLMPSILCAAALGLPFWTFLSARIGKVGGLRILCIYMVTVYAAAYFLIPYKPLVWALMICQGLGLSGFVVASSLLADVLDHDELATGEQRGGAFFGFWTFANKFGAGVGPPIVGAILALAGYVPNQPQTGATVETMRLLFGPGVAVFFLLALLTIQRFPLTREAHLEIQAEVHRRRKNRLEQQSVPRASEGKALY